ncbi:MAG: peptidoglycan-binding domain-containing protein [Firmicutes bacterium]|nr:peptidoglycan-binding domain-containing protein [Bacillota bacterium]
MSIYQQQCLLGYLGYAPGPIDGRDGPRTRAALERFREDFGLGPEGLVAAVSGTAVKPEKPDTGTFWNEIRWFTREEFRCKCGGRAFAAAGAAVADGEAVERVA